MYKIPPETIVLTQCLSSWGFTASLDLLENMMWTIGHIPVASFSLSKKCDYLTCLPTLQPTGFSPLCGTCLGITSGICERLPACDPAMCLK